MANIANVLVDDSNFQISAGNDPNTEPNQNGLAYSFGSKDPAIRQFPPARPPYIDAGCRTQKIYGLDCSGMIWFMTQHAGLLNIERLENFCVAQIAFENKWNNAFQSSQLYPDVRVKRLNQIPSTQMKNGDIIIWPGGHIGIVLNDRIYQSNGSPRMNSCLQNLDTTKGPRSIRLSQANLNVFGGGVYFIFRPYVPSGCVDIDGNEYDTVHIGNQVWMKENLRVTHYQDGSPIPEVTGNAQWASLTSGAFCHIQNNPTLTTTYGLYYNLYAVTDTRNIAPIGWHVPTDSEWNILINYLGGNQVAGGKMKEAGTTHWQSPNTGATNSSGFTALPNSCRLFDGTFNPIGGYGYLWTNIQSINNNYRSFDYLSSYVYSTGSNQMTVGHGVRCVKD